MLWQMVNDWLSDWRTRICYLYLKAGLSTLPGTISIVRTETYHLQTPAGSLTGKLTVSLCSDVYFRYISSNMHHTGGASFLHEIPHTRISAGWARGPFFKPSDKLPGNEILRQRGEVLPLRDVIRALCCWLTGLYLLYTQRRLNNIFHRLTILYLHFCVSSHSSEEAL